MVGRRGSGCTLHIRMCHHLMSHESASFWYWYCYCYCSGVDANDVCMSILNSRDKLALSNIKEDAALRAAFRKDMSPYQRRFSMKIVDITLAVSLVKDIIFDWHQKWNSYVSMCFHIWCQTITDKLPGCHSLNKISFAILFPELSLSSLVDMTMNNCNLWQFPSEEHQIKMKAFRPHIDKCTKRMNKTISISLCISRRLYYYVPELVTESIEIFNIGSFAWLHIFIMYLSLCLYLLLINIASWIWICMIVCSRLGALHDSIFGITTPWRFSLGCKHLMIKHETF